MGYPSLVRYAQGCGLAAALTLASCGSGNKGFDEQGFKNATQDTDIAQLRQADEDIQKRLRNLEWGGGVILETNDNGFTLMPTRMGWMAVAIENVRASGQDTTATIGITNTTSVFWNKCRIGYEWGMADDNGAITFISRDVVFHNINEEFRPGTRTDVTIRFPGSAPNTFNRVSIDALSCSGIRSR